MAYTQVLEYLNNKDLAMTSQIEYTISFPGIQYLITKDGIDEQMLNALVSDIMKASQNDGKNFNYIEVEMAIGQLVEELVTEYDESLPVLECVIEDTSNHKVYAVYKCLYCQHLHLRATLDPLKSIAIEESNDASEWHEHDVWDGGLHRIPYLNKLWDKSDSFKDKQALTEQGKWWMAENKGVSINEEM